jgi:general secretion pathway protein J
VRRDGGFTLLEIIVAMVVLSMIVLGLGQATRFGMTSWQVQTKLANEAAQLERVDRVLRLLIGQACAPLATDDKPFSGEAHRLVFLTLVPNQPEAGITRRSQVAIGVNDRHQLVLRWTPHPNAALLTHDPPPMQEIVLAEHMERLDFAYRQATTDGGNWSKAWTDASVPALVQIHFVRSAQYHKWPDMAVATLLDPNGSF